MPDEFEFKLDDIDDELKDAFKVPDIPQPDFSVTPDMPDAKTPDLDWPSYDFEEIKIDGID